MTRLEITLAVILAVSVILNIGLFVYARAVVVRLLGMADELWDLQEMIDAFAKHTQAVYELESFYGDQTLNNLLKHAVSLNEHLETFEHIYTLTEMEEGENTETDEAEAGDKEAS